MQESLDKIWLKALANVQKRVSIGIFVTLIKPTTLISLDNGVACIGVKRGMSIPYIQKTCGGVIAEALEEQLGEKLQIQFIVSVVTPHKIIKETVTPLFPEEKPRKVIGHLPRVRADYTFDTLAVSQSNQLAFVSAQNVAKNIGRTYNPLFIYGPVGVGKTHLMQAIANEVYRKDPDSKIVYITSEEFTNEVVEAIRSNDTAKMKRKFRSAVLLIIDDVQFIAGKDRVQEELFHTFNSLIDNGGQIVLSSDRPPNEIKKLEARLSSRFAGGLTVDVESPDFELKTAILLKKAEKFHFELPIEIAKMIAEKEQDVRSLEGALIRLMTEAQSKGQPITSSLAQGALKSHTEENKKPLHPDEVIKAICEIYNIKTTALKGPKRDAALVKVRQITMYILKNELGMTLNDIGNLLGGRDHTTVMHGVDKMAELSTIKPAINEEILGITRQIRG